MVTVQVQRPRAAVQENDFPAQTSPKQTAEGRGDPPSEKRSPQPAWRFLSQSPQKVSGNEYLARYLWLSHRAWKQIILAWSSS